MHRRSTPCGIRKLKAIGIAGEYLYSSTSSLVFCTLPPRRPLPCICQTDRFAELREDDADVVFRVGHSRVFTCV